MTDVATKKQSRYKLIASDRLFAFTVYLVLLFSLIVTLYPIYFVLIASVSNVIYVNSGEFLLFPKGLHFTGYSGVFNMRQIWIGYMNTVVYTAFGTLFGLCLSIPAGYALSRTDLPGRKYIMLIMIFTMFFNGGMIPTYINMKNLGLLNTRLVLIISGTISVYNIILIRTFFANTIPGELYEAATIDGSGNFRFFIQIVLPLSKAIIAVIGLYIAVSQWNAYFKALLYITDRNKMPLQVIIRELLVQSNMLWEIQGGNVDSIILESQHMLEVIRYSLIVVSTLPVMCFYPFIQKYFVRGVMIGSIKG
jgi:putative aldouronate transport system permease protein